MGKKFSPETMERLLSGLKHIESSNGTDLDHPVMESGMHKGFSAEGELGLMPTTIKEYAQKMMKEQPKSTPPEMMKSPTFVDWGKDSKFMDKREGLNELVDSELTPETQDAFKDSLKKNPELYKKIAERILDTVAKKTGADEESAIVNWEKGQNLGPVSKEEADENPRVQKYRDLVSGKIK